MSDLTLGIVGLGYWGPNLLRNFKDIDGLRVKYVCDADPGKWKELKENQIGLCRDIQFTDLNEILANTRLDAVVVASPTRTHYDITKRALTEGKHVFVEKPITTSIDEAVELIDIARAGNLRLMVGHVYEYSDHIARLREIIGEGVYGEERRDLGRLLRIKAERSGLSPIRNDVNAAWDLAAHDIGLIMSLSGKKPDGVVATGSALLDNGKLTEDVASIALRDNLGKEYGHVDVSWIDADRTRRLNVQWENFEAKFDDMTKKLIMTYKITKHIKPAVSYAEAEAQTKIGLGKSVVEAVEHREPLANECRHFVDCILNGKEPLTDGNYGLDVVRVLVAAQKSLRSTPAVKVEYPCTNTTR